MITLLGALLGFVSAIFPEIMQLLKSKQDNAHEIKMYNLQLESIKIQGAQRVDEIIGQADIESIKGSYTPQQITNIKWVDALNGSVKPIITYFFFFLYAYVKIMRLVHMDFAAVIDTPWLYWNEEDYGMLAAILSHWFGNRMMGKTRGAARG